MIARQCSRSGASWAIASGRQIQPRLAHVPFRAHIHSSSTFRQAATAATSSSPIPDDVDSPLPSTPSPSSHTQTSAQEFETQKKRLLTSMDMLYQIQDAPAERADITPLDDKEAQYWARRMEAAISDLEHGQTPLRVAGRKQDL